MKSISILLLILFINPAFSFELLVPKRLGSYKISNYLKEVIIPAYQEVGIKVVPVFLRENEINQRIKKGNYDALYGKLDDGNGINYSLQIPLPIVDNLETYAYKLKTAPKNKKIIKVGAIKGVMAHSKAIITNRSLFSKVEYFKNYKEVIKALLAGEIDQLLMSQLEFEHEVSIKNRELIIRTSDSLYTTRIFSYLHQKHQDKLEALTLAYKKKNEIGILKYTDYIKKFHKKKAL